MGNKNCAEFKKCMKILHLMLDNEASSEQEKYVTDHIEKCMVCFEEYEVEKHIRELIRKKLNNKAVPKGLANEIRTKIQFMQR